MTGNLQVGGSIITPQMGGADLWRLEDPAALLAMRDIMLEEAQAARACPKALFNYVMREEKTQAPLVLLPHQRVGMDFMWSHDRSVNMWPIGFAKSFCVSALTMYMLGTAPTSRGAIISATQDQAAKIVGMVRDYIEASHELRTVFPGLVPSRRRGDSWTQTEITIDRPHGIRDASLQALGIDGAIAGARLNWIIIDDLLNRENTATKEQRDKVYDWIMSSVLSRLDVRNAKVIVTNTPWHNDDVLHRLEALGWATIRMSAFGDITVKDDAEDAREALETGRPYEPWDSDDLRPGNGGKFDYTCRLAAHDPDPQDEKTLWPGEYSIPVLDKKSREFLPYRFNHLYKVQCHDDAQARCKLEWIERCKLEARKREVWGLTSRWNESRLVFTGVDLAVGLGEENDYTAFFTFAVLPGGYRRILDVLEDRMSGPAILDKLFELRERYDPVFRVENNACQDFVLQFARQRDVSLPVRPHTTGRTKAHPEHGVEGFFVEIYNGAWLIPNDKNGHCPKVVQKLVDYCTNYAPERHTPDLLMAAYFAREQAKEFGVLSGGDAIGDDGMSIGANVRIR